MQISISVELCVQVQVITRKALRFHVRQLNIKGMIYMPAITPKQKINSGKNVWR
jgi:hypothetical protein